MTIFQAEILLSHTADSSQHREDFTEINPIRHPPVPDPLVYTRTCSLNNSAAVVQLNTKISQSIAVNKFEAG